MKGFAHGALALLLVALPPLTADAGPSGVRYHLVSSTVDATGHAKRSPRYAMVDAVGQSSPAAESHDADTLLQSGFIPSTRFSLRLSTDTLGRIREALTTLLAEGGLNSRQRRNLVRAIGRLDRAIDNLAADRLIQTLNEIRQTIQNLERAGSATLPYPQLLARMAELSVRSEVNRLAAAAGETAPAIVDARVLFSEGGEALRETRFRDAVNLFKDALETALQA